MRGNFCVVSVQENESPFGGVKGGFILFSTFLQQFQSLPPSARTNHKPARQSAHQQFLSAARKALYRASASHHGISSAAHSKRYLLLTNRMLFNLN